MNKVSMRKHYVLIGAICAAIVSVYGFGSSVFAQSPNDVIINEYNDGGGNCAAPEWVELCVANGPITMGEWVLSDKNTDDFPDQGGEGNITFADDPVFDDIPDGTYIVVYIGAGTDDTDHSDGVMSLYTDNALLTTTGGFSLNATGDNIGLYALLGQVPIDYIAYGNENTGPPAGLTWGPNISGTEDEDAYFSDGANFNNDDAADWVTDADGASCQDRTIGAANPGQIVVRIVINEVDYRVNDLVEIKNLGNVTVDISSWWLCSRFAYDQISDLTATGSTNLAPGDIVYLSGFALNNTSADLGLYNTNSFGNPAAMEDFVQWGGAGIGRENVAANKGIWTAGDFVPTVVDGHSIEYEGSGDTSSDWFDQAIPTFGNDNALPVELSGFTATIADTGTALRWKTESETNNLGFWIYRSDRRDGEYVRVNPVMIRGAGTSGAPHTYEFTDTDVEEGTLYYYYIEDVAFDGSTVQSPIVQTQIAIGPRGRRLIPWGQLKRD